MEVALGNVPFQREIREWQHVDENTGALLTARVEADRWMNGPMNSYGKVIDSQNVSTPNGTQLTQRKQLEILQAKTSNGSIQVVKAHTVQSSSSRWSSSSASTLSTLQQQHENNQHHHTNGIQSIQHLLSPSVQLNNLMNSAVNPHSNNNNGKTLLSSFQHKQQQRIADEEHLKSGHMFNSDVPTTEKQYVGGHNSSERETLNNSQRFKREKSNSTEELTFDQQNFYDNDELMDWRRVSKIRRSLQFPKSVSPKFKEKNGPPEECTIVSVSKIRHELENGRRLSTAMRNNNVDMEALDTILNGNDKHEQNINLFNDKIKQTKRSTLLTVESLKEVRNKLKRLSDESLYKDDILLTTESNNVDDENENRRPAAAAATTDTTNSLLYLDGGNMIKNNQHYEITNDSTQTILRVPIGNGTIGGNVDTSIGGGEPSKIWIPRPRPVNDELIKKIDHLQQYQQQQQISNHQIRKDDSKTLIHLNGDSTIADDGLKLKRVEFCKTEVHFAAESGRVNIVETDEKPPSTNNFRRRRRTSNTTNSSITNSYLEAINNANKVMHFGDEKKLINNTIVTSTITTTTTTTTSTITSTSNTTSNPSYDFTSVNNDNFIESKTILNKFSEPSSYEPSSVFPYSNNSNSDNQVTVTIPTVGNDLKTESSSYSTFATSEDVTKDEIITNEISLRGILKNRLNKPTPYHLGENRESLWGIKLKPVDTNVRDSSPIGNNDNHKVTLENGGFLSDSILGKQSEVTSVFKNISQQNDYRTNGSLTSSEKIMEAMAAAQTKVSGFSTKVHLNSNNQNLSNWRNNTDTYPAAVAAALQNKPLTLRLGHNNSINNSNNNNNNNNNHNYSINNNFVISDNTENRDDNTDKNHLQLSNENITIDNNSLKSTSLIRKTLQSAKQFDDAMKSLELLRTASPANQPGNNSIVKSMNGLGSAFEIITNVNNNINKRKFTNGFAITNEKSEFRTTETTEHSKLCDSLNKLSINNNNNNLNIPISFSNSSSSAGLNSIAHHKSIPENSKNIEKPVAAPRFRKIPPTVTLPHPIPQQRKSLNSKLTIPNTDRDTNFDNVDSKHHLITPSTVHYDHHMIDDDDEVTSIFNKLTAVEDENPINNGSNQLGSWSRVKAMKNLLKESKLDESSKYIKSDMETLTRPINTTTTINITANNTTINDNDTKETSKLISGIRPLREHELCYFGDNYTKNSNETNNKTNSAIKTTMVNTVPSSYPEKFSRSPSPPQQQQNDQLHHKQPHQVVADQLTSTKSQINFLSNVVRKLSNDKPDLLRHPNIEQSSDYVNLRSINDSSKHITVDVNDPDNIYENLITPRKLSHDGQIENQSKHLTTDHNQQNIINHTERKIHRDKEHKKEITTTKHHRDRSSSSNNKYKTIPNSSVTAKSEQQSRDGLIKLANKKVIHTHPRCYDDSLQYPIKSRSTSTSSKSFSEKDSMYRKTRRTSTHDTGNHLTSGSSSSRKEKIDEIIIYPIRNNMRRSNNDRNTNSSGNSLKVIIETDGSGNGKGNSKFYIQSPEKSSRNDELTTSTIRHRRHDKQKSASSSGPTKQHHRSHSHRSTTTDGSNNERQQHKAITTPNDLSIQTKTGSKPEHSKRSSSNNNTKNSNNGTSVVSAKQLLQSYLLPSSKLKPQKKTSSRSSSSNNNNNNFTIKSK